MEPRDPEDSRPAEQEHGAAEAARSPLVAWVLSGSGGTPRLALVVVCVLAFSAVLLGLKMWLNPPQSSPALRPRGVFIAAIDVQRGQKRWRLGSEHWLQPGDKLRFIYDAPRDGYLYVVGLATSRVTLYEPRGEPRLVARGKLQRVPDAVVLDDAIVGTERIIALLCPTLVPRARVLGAARSAVSRARGAAAVARLALPCVQSSRLVQRRAGAK